MTDIGVFGVSTSGEGVRGQSESSIGTFGGSDTGIGVFGRSETGTGVIGQSNGDPAGEPRECSANIWLMARALLVRAEMALA